MASRSAAEFSPREACIHHFEKESQRPSTGGKSAGAASHSAMRASQGGRNLIALNMAHDIELAAEVDRFAMSPRYQPAAQVIESQPSGAARSP